MGTSLKYIYIQHFKEILLDQAGYDPEEDLMPPPCQGHENKPLWQLKVNVVVSIMEF